uniref:Uncharacterized protein n=1 Tax=Meloidogyne enterolobii TaxID=390850 RepID=A0A6V7W2L5_MELEN|nr:unnamed protein product [Meloidogyne enterolobii]
MSGGEFKLKIIKEKFVKIENKLKDLGEEEDLSKVDDIFKSSLAELHLERLKKHIYGSFARNINSIKTKNDDKMDENKFIVFKSKLRYVLDDMMFKEIELKNPILLRIDLVEKTEQIRRFGQIILETENVKERTEILASQEFTNLTKHNDGRNIKINEFIKRFEDKIVKGISNEIFEKEIDKETLKKDFLKICEKELPES